MQKKRLTIQQANTLALKPNVVVVDIRDALAFRNGTLPNATNMSLRRLSLLQTMPKNQKVLLIGDPTDEQSLNVATTYVELYGFTTVHTVLLNK